MVDNFEVPSLDNLNHSDSGYVSQLNQDLLNMDSRYHWIDEQAEVLFSGLVARLKEKGINEDNYSTIKGSKHCADYPGYSRKSFEIKIKTEDEKERKKIEDIIDAHKREVAPQLFELLEQEKKLDKAYAEFRTAAAEVSDINPLRPVDLEYNGFVIYLQGDEDILEMYFDINDLKKSELLSVKEDHTKICETHKLPNPTPNFPKLTDPKFLDELREETKNIPFNIYIVTNSIERVVYNEVFFYARHRIIKEVSELRERQPELKEKQPWPYAQQFAKDLMEKFMKKSTQSTQEHEE
ncbi:MAG: hypothetical protein KAT77_04670 [Nanoarchaeota archaeon]|nr:hypothetical protein [Nanoarchaeota archaeon]